MLILGLGWAQAGIRLGSGWAQTGLRLGSGWTKVGHSLEDDDYYDADDYE